MPIIVIYADYSIDNGNEPPVDGEDDSGNTEHEVENIEKDEVEAGGVAVLAKVEEGELKSI